MFSFLVIPHLSSCYLCFPFLIASHEPSATSDWPQTGAWQRPFCPLTPRGASTDLENPAGSPSLTATPTNAFLQAIVPRAATVTKHSHLYVPEGQGRGWEQSGMPFAWLHLLLRIPSDFSTSHNLCAPPYWPGFDHFWMIPSKIWWYHSKRQIHCYSTYKMQPQTGQEQHQEKRQESQKNTGCVEGWSAWRYHSWTYYFWNHIIE